jgi:hypothetical protein
MRIRAAADLHGHLPDVEPCELLLLAGDILPDEGQEEFVWGPLRDWMSRAPARDIIWIAGNHDFYLEGDEWQERSADFPGTYLRDSGTQVGEISIWGTPWVERMPPGWAFSVHDAREHFARIPASTDLLLSHCPPAGILDRVGAEQVGSVSLASAINRVAPRAAIFGHIHECGGEHLSLGETDFWNVSLAGPGLRPEREPATIDKIF